MFKYVVLAVALSGCGSMDDFFVQRHERESDPRTINVDAGLNAKMRELAHLIKRDAGDVRIGFEDLDGLAGVCRVWTGNRTYREIGIDNTFYKNSEEKQVEQVILHELGHCVLGRDHNDAKDDEGYPVSIMRSFAFSRWEIKHYLANLDSYLKELVGE